MIDIKTQLSIKHESGESYTDYSHKASNFGRDSFALDLVSEDSICIGFRKPINGLYLNHLTSYEVEGECILQYWNGSAWVNANGLVDDTLGLKRSGFIRFDRDLIGQAQSSINGATLYWYKLKVSIAREGLTVSGINLVFADDYDLMLEQPYVTMPEFLGSLKSHILIHAACRNEIIQKFRLKDFYKTDASGNKQDINQWDLLEIQEVKQAAVFMAMSKIYSNMSDTDGDIWAVKAAEYNQKAEAMIDLSQTSLDYNDNGKDDDKNIIPPTSGTRFLNR